MAPEAGITLQSEFALFLEQNLNKELLRFTTAGSVDDGKSTLIGRLLHDSKSLYEDQLASVKNGPVNRSSGPIDFSLLTDGLRAEREQGITIDVGYRYFTTARRKFIIADTPGHEQYTRNMATGASTADLAVILVDGEKGLLPQTTRHAYIASLLGIPSVVAAINKMDLVGYREERFLTLKEEFLALAERLGLEDVECIPISALAGDNVVERSARMGWHRGPTLLEHLETTPITRPSNTRGFRFPVQYVIRPDANFRGFAGQVVGGVIRPGDAVTALPSGLRSRVESIVTYDGSLAEAFSPMAVTLKLEDEIDLSRGDMLVALESPPSVSQRFAATMVWMHAQPLESGRTYLIKQTARQVPGKVTRIRHRVNINTLEPEAADRLDINDIAAVEIETNRPLFFDSYSENRTTGSFIVIDPLTNATLGAGMIRENLPESSEKWTKLGTADSETAVSPLERHRRHGHYPAIILVDARAELARRIERALFDDGFEVMVVGEETSSLASAKTAWFTWRAAGFVVIYQSSSLGAEERLELKTAAGDRFFDLADLQLVSGDADALERVLAFARTLRIRAEDETTGKVN
ncbi:MAG TPA: sulfate adenylyltransferase subunit CysN [Candidatus Acidoferrales bacterium]|jgi:sulfate adenylyltransferase subunit 1|nr:sulfate adenylyltransferase subunit CysN [Candidatus Acidoferrales bacterium]